MNRNVVISTVLGVLLLILGGIAYYSWAINGVLQAQSVPPPPSPFAAFGPDCQIAPVNADHVFVAAAVNRGDTLASLQLGDANGRTTIVRVVVEKGSNPITVLLQAEDAVIWDFEGAVDRIARAMIVSDHRDRAAVRGLPAANVDILRLARCPVQRMPFGNVSDKRADSVFQGLFGRVPQRLGVQEAPNAVAMPAVAFGQAPTSGPERNTATEAERDLLRNYSGGFRVLDAASLVARSPVLSPETYPGEAGYVQLERSGAIRPATEADIAAFSDGFSKLYRSKISPDYRQRIDFTYAVTREVRLPGAMNVGFLHNLIVLSGVPAPRGSVGRGCLAFMDGFKTSDDGPLCFGSEAADALHRLGQLPDPAAAQQCHQMSVAADASIEAVSMYQPKGARHSGGSKRIPEPLDVRVSKPGAVLLVLNTYEPAIWRISTAEGTQIAGVIMTGYYTSKIEGLAPGIPVLSIDFEGRQARPAVDPVCAPFLSYLGTAFHGGPAATVLDRQVEALTGRHLDSLRGDYTLGSADIR